MYQDASKFPSASIKYVPSLVSLCILILSQYPDQVHHLPPGFPDYSQFDILRALIPTYSDAFSPEHVDPKLWATLVQLFSNSLPSSFTTYFLPFSDVHLPLLQSIPVTPSCVIITVLELPGCEELTDHTITKLRFFHRLVALDASDTYLTNLGISRLATACRWSTEEHDKPERRGPWGLRILRLRNCRAVDNVSIQSLSKFILLSVIDLRGTAVIPSAFATSWRAIEPPSSNLYHPTPLTESLSLLESIASLYSSSSTFRVHVDRLSHQNPQRTFPSPYRHVHASRQVLLEGPFTSFQSSSLNRSRSLDELEAMSRVATAELQAESRKRMLREFYASPPSREPLIFLDPPDGSYSAQRYYRSFREKLAWPTFTGSTPKLDDLMLYRYPASPDSLDSMTMPLSAKKEKSMGQMKASLNRGRSKMVDMADEQRQLMAKRRRVSYNSRPVFGDGTVSVQHSFTETSPGTKSTLAGRNPFRKAIGACPPAGHQSSCRFVSITSCIPNSTTPDGGGVSSRGITRNQFSNHISKPLKPISSIPVPSLPPEEKRKLKAVAIKEEATLTKKRTSAKQSPLDDAQTRDIRPMLKSVASAESVNPKAGRVPGSSSSGVPKRHSLNMNNTKGLHTLSERFSWKAWANG